MSSRSQDLTARCGSRRLTVPSAEAVLGDVLPADGMTARVMRDGTSVVLSDGRADPRVRHGALQEAGFGPTIYVPLGAPGNIMGTLVVARHADRPVFDPDVLPVVENFAGQAAIALRLGAAAADREQLAVLGDRDRIARDLHDLVIQRLFATGMALEGALRGMEPPEKADRVRHAVDDLDTTIKEIRTAIFALQVQPSESKESLRSCRPRDVHRWSDDVGVRAGGDLPRAGRRLGARRDRRTAGCRASRGAVQRRPARVGHRRERDGHRGRRARLPCGRRQRQGTRPRTADAAGWPTSPSGPTSCTESSPRRRSPQEARRSSGRCRSPTDMRMSSGPGPEGIRSLVLVGRCDYTGRGSTGSGSCDLGASSSTSGLTRRAWMKPNTVSRNISPAPTKAKMAAIPAIFAIVPKA